MRIDLRIFRNRRRLLGTLQLAVRRSARGRSSRIECQMLRGSTACGSGGESSSWNPIQPSSVQILGSCQSVRRQLLSARVCVLRDDRGRHIVRCMSLRTVALGHSLASADWRGPLHGRAIPRVGGRVPTGAMPVPVADARISFRSSRRTANSREEQVDAERIGKIPGIWTDDGWIGFQNWTRTGTASRRSSKHLTFNSGRAATSRPSDCKLKSTQHRRRLRRSGGHPQSVKASRRPFSTKRYLIRQRRIAIDPADVQAAPEATPSPRARCAHGAKRPNKICEIEVPAPGSNTYRQPAPVGVPYEWASAYTLTASI